MDIPPIIHLTKNARTALSNNAVFTKQELIGLLDGYELEKTRKSIITWLKLNGYLYQSSDCRWRRTDKLDELLADGVTEIQTS